MNAGTLDKRIKIMQFQDVETEYETTEQQLVERLSCWARIEPARGREYYEAQRIRTVNSYKITIRFRPNLNESMIIKYGARQFEIQNIVDPYESHVYLELYCTEKTRGEGAAT